jgi:uncharacterized protein YsxB (DUF464 family)
MELTARGHAGVAACGSDPVCAGVSALLYGYLAFVEELLPETGGSLEAEEGEGFLRITHAGLGERGRQGFRAVEAGLRLIAEAYPRAVRLIQGRDTEDSPPAIETIETIE